MKGPPFTTAADHFLTYVSFGSGRDRDLLAVGLAQAYVTVAALLHSPYHNSDFSLIEVIRHRTRSAFSFFPALYLLERNNACLAGLFL